MAHTWHPDKNPGNRESLAYFNLVKEAYETLTIPRLRKKYLEERWLQQSTGMPFENFIKTPENLLKRLVHLFGRTLHMDEYRMDKEGLFDDLMKLLDEEHMALLKDVKDNQLNREITGLGIKISRMLPPGYQLKTLKKLELIDADPASASMVRGEMKRLKVIFFWNKYRLLFIIGIVIFICWLIWLTGM